MYKNGPMEALYTGTVHGDADRQILQLTFQSAIH